VPHPGLTDFEWADPGYQVAFGSVTVADYHGSIRFGSPASASLHILLDLILEGGLEHLARPFSDELFQGRLSLNFCWLLQR
jgi:hypothetical protein